MERTHLDGLDHIRPVSYRYPELETVTSSPFGDSETKSIHPVTINLSSLGLDDCSGSVVFCDTPGFGENIT